MHVCMNSWSGFLDIQCCFAHLFNLQVSEATEKLAPGCEVIACGSYRRGKKDW